MNWHRSRKAARERLIAKYSPSESVLYDASVGRLSAADEDAYLADLKGVFMLDQGTASVLDVGAGTGTLCQILRRFEGVTITALEPSTEMLACLTGKSELADVTPVQGFCDSIEDRALFGADHFDVIISRQLVNGLFDPLAAFGNWYHWLVPGGAVVAIDGLYGRDAWTGHWDEEVDVLPMSACQSTAMLPYLLQVAGFEVESTGMMDAVNARPATVTPRYVVVARKPLAQT